MSKGPDQNYTKTIRLILIREGKPIYISASRNDTVNTKGSELWWLTASSKKGSKQLTKKLKANNNQ